MDSILQYLPYRSSLVAAQMCSSRRLKEDSEAAADSAPTWYPRRFIRANRRPIEHHWKLICDDTIVTIVPRREISTKLDADMMVKEGRSSKPRRPYALTGHHRFLFLVAAKDVLQHCVEVTISDSDRYPISAEETEKWLQNVEFLEALCCRNTRLLTVAFLAKICPSLRVVDLQQAAIQNDGLIGLERAPSMRVLHLAWCTNLTCVKTLSGSSTLCVINLRWTCVTSDGIDGLQNIPTLEKLLLDNTPVDRVKFLANSKSLKHLSLKSTRVTANDVGDLAALATLEELLLDGCQELRSVGGLSTSKSLVTLSFRDAPVDTEGTLGLERIPTLKSLSLSQTDVADINHLAASTSLAVIEAQFCDSLRPNGVENFKSMTKVRVLVGGNVVADSLPIPTYLQADEDESRE